MSWRDVDDHNRGDCVSTCSICAAAEDQPRLSVDDDADGVTCVWAREHRPGHEPVAVLRESDVPDEVLWAAIVELVESGGVA